MKNIDVLKSFINAKNTCKTQHLKNIQVNKNGTLNVLYNYNAKIAIFIFSNVNKEYYIIINQKYLHYTKTTQIIINKLIALATDYAIRIKYQELYN